MGDFCENVVGMHEYTYDNKDNKWSRFINIVGEVPLPTSDLILRKSNKNSFTEQELEALENYLLVIKDWQAIVVLRYAERGEDLLNLTYNEVLDLRDVNCNKWLRYIEREAFPFNNAIITQFEKDRWRPATLEDLEKFEKCFSTYLGREFILC